MRRSILARALLCVLVGAGCLYAYIDTHNEVTRRRLMIPVLAHEIKEIREHAIALRYEIDRFESPAHLMELASRSEYAHLKHPFLQDILAFQEARPLEGGAVTPSVTPAASASSALVGARP